MVSNSSNRPLTDAVIAFCRFMRAEGFNIGMRETFDAVRTAQLDLLPRKSRFRQGLRSLLCSSEAEWLHFDALFDQFWSNTGSSPRRNRNVRPLGKTTRMQERKSLPGLGAATEGSLEDEGSSTTGASALERLRKTDFSEVSAGDREELARLIARFARQMRPRMARRLRAVPKKIHLDLRRTIRRSINYGGDPVDLRYRGPKPRKPRLVALLDVSGSMDRYSFFLLRFIHALRPHFERVDAFVFSTRLEKVTEAVGIREFSSALIHLEETVETWSSGTRIGPCLETFNAEHARRIVTGNTIVVILSDGLDTGDPDLLATELNAIKQRARKLIWLNPLSGMKGYQPTARGMAAALPLVDAFVGAHNLDALLDLEEHLSNV